MAHPRAYPNPDLAARIDAQRLNTQQARSQDELSLHNRGIPGQEGFAILHGQGGLGGVAREAVSPFAAFLANPGLSTGVGAAAALPVPWGMPGRTGPARTVKQKMINQARLDLWKDAQRSIQAAPQLDPLQAFAQSQLNAIGMRRAGVGTFQPRRLAAQDQRLAVAAHLNSLLPDPGVDALLNETQKTAIGNALLAARNKALEGMAIQEGAPLQPRIDMDPRQAVPAHIEAARRTIQDLVYDEAARRNPIARQLTPFRKTHPDALTLYRAHKALTQAKPGFALERPERLH